MPITAEARAQGRCLSALVEAVAARPGSCRRLVWAEGGRKPDSDADSTSLANHYP